MHSPITHKHWLHIVGVDSKMLTLLSGGLSGMQFYAVK